MNLLQRYEQQIQQSVEADRAAGGTGFGILRMHCLMWLMPMTLGTAVAVNLIHSVAGGLIFMLPFVLVTVAGIPLATRAAIRAGS